MSDENKRPITSKEAAEVAVLARLALDENQCSTLAEELGAVLEHMAILDDIDTDGIEPMTHVTDAEMKLRPDEILESFSQEVALGAAPKSQDGCFVVPVAIPSK